MDPDFSRQKISILQNLEKFENFWIFFKWCSRHMLTRLDIFVLGLTRLGTLELSDSRLINSTIFKIFWWCLSFAAFIFINSLFKKNIISSTFLNHIIRKHGFYIKPLSTSNRENEDLVERPLKTVRRKPFVKSCPPSPIEYFVGTKFNPLQQAIIWKICQVRLTSLRDEDGPRESFEMVPTCGVEWIWFLIVTLYPVRKRK